MPVPPQIKVWCMTCCMEPLVLKPCIKCPVVHKGFMHHCVPSKRKRAVHGTLWNCQRTRNRITGNYPDIKIYEMDMLNCQKTIAKLKQKCYN